MIPSEFRFEAKPNKLKWFVGIMYVFMFAVLGFQEAKKVTGTILTINAIMIFSTLPILFKKVALEKLLSPIIISRAVFVQILVQISIYTYWGQFNLAAITRLPLVFHQICFGYLFVFLLSHFSGKKFKLSFSPAAAILSANLFVWFASQIYFSHYALIMVAMTAKTFITRSVNGEERHIFNPSGFASNIAAVIISLITVGAIQNNIYASQMGANFLWLPNFDTFVFFASCVSLWAPNMYLVPIACITTMTLFELWSHHYYGMSFTTETPRGSILLGITLLITDPATAPRSKTGQFLYGVGYAFSIFISFIIIAFFSWQMYFVKVFFLIPLNLLSYKIDLVGMWVEKNILEKINFKWPEKKRKMLLTYFAVSVLSTAILSYRHPPPYFLDFSRRIQPRTADLKYDEMNFHEPSFFQMISPMHFFHMFFDIFTERNRPLIRFQSSNPLNEDFDQFKKEYK
jgi:hypothetical protein